MMTTICKNQIENKLNRKKVILEPAHCQTPCIYCLNENRFTDYGKTARLF